MENGLLHNKPIIIEPISTPNKNITSTYDKKEESYLVNSKYKFPQYRRNINALCNRISFALKSCLFNYQKNFKLSKNEKNIISKISEFDE